MLVEGREAQWIEDERTNASKYRQMRRKQETEGDRGRTDWVAVEDGLKHWPLGCTCAVLDCSVDESFALAKELE